MENYSSYQTSSEYIENVLEIRLCLDTWEKIKRISKVRKTSYSWVVRYATFRLIKRKNVSSFILGKQEFSQLDGFWFNGPHLKLNQRVLLRRPYSRLKHRHKLCLYGADELLIRLTAARLGCSMTHLIRFALEKYVDKLMDHLFQTSPKRFLSASHLAFWYWLGIKIQRDVEFPTKSISLRLIHFSKYEKHDYF